MGRKRTEINPIRAERVKTIIQREKLNQKQLADVLNRTQQNINNIVQGKTGLTEEAAKQIIALFPHYRLQWLLGYDDIMFHTDELRQVIHRKVNTAEAKIQVISLIVDDICKRENITRPDIPSSDFYVLQEQLHDYAELIISDYLKNRKNSRTWKRIDNQAPMQGGDKNEKG